MVYNDFRTVKGLLNLPLWLIVFIILLQRLHERFNTVTHTFYNNNSSTEKYVFNTQLQMHKAWLEFIMCEHHLIACSQIQDKEVGEQEFKTTEHLCPSV